MILASLQAELWEAESDFLQEWKYEKTMESEGWGSWSWWRVNFVKREFQRCPRQALPTVVVYRHFLEWIHALMMCVCRVSLDRLAQGTSKLRGKFRLYVHEGGIWSAEKDRNVRIGQRLKTTAPTGDCSQSCLLLCSLTLFTLSPWESDLFK